MKRFRLPEDCPVSPSPTVLLAGRPDQRLPPLSRPPVGGLAWFRFGRVLAHCCSVPAGAVQRAEQVGQKFDPVQQRLRDWYGAASAKALAPRKELDVRACFAPW